MKNCSFKDYVALAFDNQFWAAAENYLNENMDSLHIDLYHVHRAGDFEIENVNVEHVWTNNLPGMKIQFDVALSVTFIIYEGDYHYDDYDEKQIWLMIRCRGDLDKDLKDFEIFDVSDYMGKNKAENPMDDDLVPVINSGNLDSVAEDFLRRHYEKALLEPEWVNPTELAESMGLTVKLAYITKEGDIFGRSYFFDADAELYDPDTDSTYTEHIPAGTILVDKQCAYMYVIGATNNTVIHECVHWDMHKKAFALARLYNKELTNIGCKVIGGIDGNDSEDNAVYWMEWQANALTPRIQMPITMFKKRVDELLSQYRRILGKYDMIDIIEPVIDQLVVDFGVSRTAAKIRMIDAGYDVARGAFNYIDGHYVKPYRTSSVNIKDNETFSVSIVDAACETMFNPDLKELVESGVYLYVDSHLVVNHKRYIETDEFGHPALTHYARNHMEECCVVFQLSIKTNVGRLYHSICFLNRDKASQIKFQASYMDQGKEKDHAKLLTDYRTDLLEAARKMPSTFSGALNYLIEWSGMTEEELAEAAELSEKTIQRLRNTEPDNVSIETVVQLCIGLSLPPLLSERLLETSGKKLMMTEQHVMYHFLLTCCYDKTIYECDQLLYDQGLNLIGNGSKKEFL